MRPFERSEVRTAFAKNSRRMASGGHRRTLLSRLKTPTYENTDSTARDHLASERTFLAWLRTGLGFVALGIAVERFSQLDISALLPPLPVTSQTVTKRQREKADQNKEKVLVGALLGTGCGAIVYGVTRHFSTMRLLERGLFKPAYYGAGGLGLAVAGLAGAIYWSSAGRDVED